MATEKHFKKKKGWDEDEDPTTFGERPDGIKYIKKDYWRGWPKKVHAGLEPAFLE
jgi:hypothetical protein